MFFSVYRCPRFILHHKHEAGLTTLTPSHRHSLCRSYSTTPMTLQDHTHQQAPNAHYNNPDSEIARNYPKNPSPFVPTQTPTFRKLPTNRSKPATRNSKASRQKHTVIQEPEETAFASDTGHDCNQNFSNKSSFTPHRPHTVPGSAGRAAGGGGGGGEGVNSRIGGGRLTAEEEGAKRASSEAVSSSSRKVWNRQGWECSTSSSSRVSTHRDTAGRHTLDCLGMLSALTCACIAVVQVDSRRSESRNRAKYTLHHLPDPTSRCASAIVSLHCTVLYTYVCVLLHLQYIVHVPACKLYMNIFPCRTLQESKPCATVDVKSSQWQAHPSTPSPPSPPTLTPPPSPPPVCCWSVAVCCMPLSCAASVQNRGRLGATSNSTSRTWIARYSL